MATLEIRILVVNNGFVVSHDHIESSPFPIIGLPANDTFIVDTEKGLLDKLKELLDKEAR